VGAGGLESPLTAAQVEEHRKAGKLVDVAGGAGFHLR
jgi:hypothetical protein